MIPKIDKFSFIDRQEDLSLFAKNLCNELGLQNPDASSLTNANSVFLSATETVFKEMIDKREKLDQEKTDRELATAQFEAERAQLRETSQRLKISLLEKEYHTIEDDFHHFGKRQGICFCVESGRYRCRTSGMGQPARHAASAQAGQKSHG